MSQCKSARCFTELVNLTSYGCHNRYVYYKPLSNKCSIPMKEISESNLFSLVGEMFRQYHNTIYCNRFGVVYSETLPRAGEVFPTCRNIRWNKQTLEIILYLLRG